MLNAISLKDKVCVILGGAGAIGATTARIFAAAGAHVVITHCGDAHGETTEGDAAVAVLASLSGAGHSAFCADVGDSASLAALQDFVERTFSRCDVLINTAGHAEPIAHDDLDGLTDDIIDEIFCINWRGQLATVRTFAPLLRASGDGLIVLITSTADDVARTGIEMMTKSLARAAVPDIRLLGVSYGLVATGLVPGCTAQVDNVAAAILACATDITVSSGTNIVVDGSQTL